MAHKIPASEARRIFVAAENFAIAHRVLVESVRESQRTIPPQVMVAAFTVELFLKCLLVDSGAPTIPAKHDLAMLFNNLPPATRAAIEKVWKEYRQFLKEKGDAPSDVPAKIADIFAKCANYFDDWRFYFEHAKSTLTLDSTPVAALGVLHVFILRLHPDWKQDSDQYFLSTFPVP